MMAAASTWRRRSVGGVHHPPRSIRPSSLARQPRARTWLLKVRPLTPERRGGLFASDCSADSQGEVVVYSSAGQPALDRCALAVGLAAVGDQGALGERLEDTRLVGALDQVEPLRDCRG